MIATKQSPTMRPAAKKAPPATLRPARSAFARGNGALTKLFRAAKDDEPCPKCASKLQRKAGPGSDPEEVPPIVYDVLRSPGQPLDENVRTDMEARFGGADFGDVRIHSDSNAAKSADAVNARAFTVGSHIVVGTDHAGFKSIAGSRLLTHELVHVVQQPSSFHSSFGKLEVMSAHHPLEQAAKRGEQGLTESVAPDAVGKVASPMVQRSSDDQDPNAPQNDQQQDDQQQDTSLGGTISEIVSNLIARAEGLLPDRVQELIGIRDQVAARASIEMDDSELADGQAFYGRLSASAPFWLPVPSVTFAPPLVNPYVLLSAIVLLLLLYVLLLLRGRTVPDPAGEEWIKKLKERLKPKPETDPEQKPQPEPKPGPGPVDPIPNMRCSPTGLTPTDAIPMTWFKPRIDNYYPSEIIVAGLPYGRDDGPTYLPTGEPIGVAEQYWPSVGKVFQLIPDVRGPGAGRFRAVLERYGFDWTGLQADHVQDIEFEGPDDSGFVNLWPMDASANMSAGASTNAQVIQVCIGGPTDPSPVSDSLKNLKSSVYGRYFVIRDVMIGPP